MSKAELAKLLKENGIVILTEEKYADLLSRAANADGIYEFCADCIHLKDELQSSKYGFCEALQFHVCKYGCGNYHKKKGV